MSRTRPRAGVLKPGDTCWRIEPAQRAAFMVDNEAYYTALYDALARAQRSIWILGWAFDPRTRLAPDGYEGPDDPDEIGQILLRLTRAKPDLDVRILIWRSALSINGGHPFLERRARKLFEGTGVDYREDGETPLGACHHQKLVVIDEQIAFCGGGDITANRWDTAGHVDGDPRRILPHRLRHAPRHEVMMLVQGDVAATLGELFCERWRRATGEPLKGVRDGGDRWPLTLSPQLAQSEVAVVRTEPLYKGRAGVDEIRRLALASIATAKSAIYLENQYLTSKPVTQALIARLGERAGPEVVVVLPGRAPSWFDRITMDHARVPLLRRLLEADRYGRFRAFAPRTASGAPIIVHSKVSIFDDDIVRVGSANLNNRSEGFDTECELAIEASDPRSRREIAQLRDRLLAHFLGVTETEFIRARVQTGGLIGAIDRLNSQQRLTPIAPRTVSWWDAFVSRHRLGDPAAPAESWRLFKDGLAGRRGSGEDQHRLDPAQSAVRKAS